MNFRKRIAKRIYVARYGAGVRLPFFMEDDNVYIEDSLVGIPGYENYDGRIHIEKGNTNYESSSGDGWNEPREPESWSVEFEATPESSRIIKYNPGVFDILPTPLVNIEEDIKNGYATEVVGEEKQGVINTFMNKYRDVLQEYLDEKAEESARDN